VVKVCVEAVKAINNHEWRHEIQLSDRLTLYDYRDGSLSHVGYAFEIVAIYHLDQWLNSEWQ
jgi:hypothetical protein